MPGLGQLLEATGALWGGGRALRMSPRQFWLLVQGHWCESTGTWEAAGCPAGPGPPACLDEAAGRCWEHLALV